MDQTLIIPNYLKSFLKWCTALFLFSFPLWLMEWDISDLSLRDVLVKQSEGTNAKDNDYVTNARDDVTDNITGIVTANATHNLNLRTNNVSNATITDIVTANAMNNLSDDTSHNEHSHHTHNHTHHHTHAAVDVFDRNKHNFDFLHSRLFYRASSAIKSDYSPMPFYHGLWDFETHSISIPNKQPGDKITSLEILQNVLQENETHNGSPNRSCLIADVERTEDLARSGVDLPLPILNLGMPKCGSSTLHKFFSCAGLFDRHGEEGKCIADAVKKGKPPLSGCSKTRGKDSLTQMDIQHPERGKGNCWFPQISFLDEIHQEFPNATFVMNFRPVDDWIRSAANWGTRTMSSRWSQCSIPGLVRAGEKLTEEEIRNWLCGHVKHVREFVKQYSSHKLIELDLYDTKRSSRVMSSLFDAKKSCWGLSNMHQKIHNE